MPTFQELPFNARPDLTPYLLHMTKHTKADEYSAFDNLVNILQTGQIWGTGASGYVKGPAEAACFMDVPFASLKYVLTPENMDPQKPRYEPYGVVVTKSLAYRRGCRPVHYLSDEETEALGIPSEELWRVVRFEADRKRWISWLHEREWRCKNGFKLPRTLHAVLVRNVREARKLRERLAADPDGFACQPSSIVPLSVLCQGLLA